VEGTVPSRAGPDSRRDREPGAVAQPESP
jgi:hypothetical protein